MCSPDMVKRTMSTMRSRIIGMAVFKGLRARTEEKGLLRPWSTPPRESRGRKVPRMGRTWGRGRWSVEV